MKSLIIRRLVKLTEETACISYVGRSRGFLAAAAQALTVIEKRIFSRSEAVHFVRALEEPVTGADTLEGVTVREAQAQDFVLFEPVVERSGVLWYRQLLARSRTCLIALKEGQLAAYVWLSHEIDPQLEGTYVPLAPGDVYVMDIRTLPTFRRQGFQKILLKHTLEWAKLKGYSRIVSVVVTSNQVSLELHHKLGYQCISRRTITRVLNVRHIRYNPNLFGKAGDVLIVVW